MGNSFIHPLRNMFNMTVVDRSKKPEFQCNYFRSLDELTGKFDYIVFAVKPFQLKDVLDDLSLDFLNKDARVLSLIAGAKSNIFHQKFGKKAKVSLCMSNLPVKIGKGVTAVYSDQKLDFLERLGQTIYVNSEDEIGKYFYRSKLKSIIFLI